MIICEVCNKEPACSISLIGHYFGGQWKLVGQCSPERENYYIEFWRLNELDWMDHLLKKNWFNPKDFSECLLRLAYKAWKSTVVKVDRE